MMARFLVLVRPRRNITPHPEQPGRVKQFQDTYTHAKDWAQQQKQAGHVVDAFGVAANPAGVTGASIVEANSADEVMQKAHTFPMASFVDFDVYPLIDFNQQMDTIAQQIPQQLHHP